MVIWPGEEFIRMPNISREYREVLHMKTAYLWSQRSEDPRLKVGCIITTHDMREILSFGYNGPAKGLPPSFIRSTPGNSGCLHAEENAMLYSGGARNGKLMFVTHLPCEYCAQRIVQHRVARVFYSEMYRCTKGAEVLKQCGVTLTHLHIHEDELLQSIRKQ